MWLIQRAFIQMNEIQCILLLRRCCSIQMSIIFTLSQRQFCLLVTGYSDSLEFGFVLLFYCFWRFFASYKVGRFEIIIVHSMLLLDHSAAHRVFYVPKRATAFLFVFEIWVVYATS